MARKLAHQLPLSAVLLCWHTPNYQWLRQCCRQSVTPKIGNKHPEMAQKRQNVNYHAQHLRLPEMVAMRGSLVVGDLCWNYGVGCKALCTAVHCDPLTGNWWVQHTGWAFHPAVILEVAFYGVRRKVTLLYGLLIPKTTESKESSHKKNLKTVVWRPCQHSNILSLEMIRQRKAWLSWENWDRHGWIDVCISGRQYLCVQALSSTGCWCRNPVLTQASRKGHPQAQTSSLHHAELFSDEEAPLLCFC